METKIIYNGFDLKQIYRDYLQIILPYPISVKNWKRIIQKKSWEKLKQFTNIMKEYNINHKEYFQFCKNKNPYFNLNMVLNQKYLSWFINYKAKDNKTKITVAKYHIKYGYIVYKKIKKIWKTDVIDLIQKDGNWIVDVYKHPNFGSFLIIFYPFINWNILLKEKFIDFEKNTLDKKKKIAYNIYMKIKNTIYYKKFIQGIKDGKF